MLRVRLFDPIPALNRCMLSVEVPEMWGRNVQEVSIDLPKIFISICPYRYMKKNTLVYLDENLVKSAKSHDLNISRITEDALRSRLFPILSSGERQLDFEGHMDKLKKDERCYFLPFMIDNLRLKNIGPFEEIELSFDGGINTILGPNESGKTMIIKSLARGFGLFEPTFGSFLKSGEEKGCVKIGISGENCIKADYGISEGKVEVNGHIKSILLDEPVNFLNQENKEEFIGWIRKRFDCQVILATIDENMAKLGDEVIELQ